MSDAWSIREVSVQTGVSAHTLRYYERAGLIRIPRAANGHRRYGPAEVRWISFLRRLHATGMPIRRMRDYARLVWRGDSTAGDRLALLSAHRDDVVARLDELRQNLELIETKIRTYETLSRSYEPPRATAERARRRSGT